MNSNCPPLAPQPSQDSGASWQGASGEELSLDCYLKQFKAGHSLVEAVLRLYEVAAAQRRLEAEEREREAKEARKKSSSLKTEGKKQRGGVARQSVDGGGLRTSQQVRCAEELCKQN